jgi:hypothetical protein
VIWFVVAGVVVFIGGLLIVAYDVTRPPNSPTKR